MRRAFGPEAANSVPRRLVAPSHREGGQAQSVPRPVAEAREGARLRPVIERMRAGLAGEQPLAALPHGGVEVVAAAVGFGSAATLRHHFRRRFGVSPVANRGRFGG